MTTRLFAITAVALAAALSACVVSPPTRVAMAQASHSSLAGVSTGPAIDCDNGGFDAPDAMKLPKAAFGSCTAQ